MKIQLERYNPEWKNTFNAIRLELWNQIHFLNPVIEHIGSTSIPEISAKPIIDILVGIHSEKQLDEVVDPLIEKGYIYHEKYNHEMPYRRFFVSLKAKPNDLIIPKVYYQNDDIPTELHNYKLAHIHILKHNTEHWIRHIAFRDYVNHHDPIKRDYEELKISLSKKDWIDGNEYNAAKDSFIKEVERKAIEWYHKKI